MQVYSQQLEFLRPLSSGGDAGVWLVRDMVGDARRVFRGPGPADTTRPADLIPQIRLLRLLDESGFTGVEDVIRRNGGATGFTTRFVESRPLREVAWESGIPALLTTLQLLCQSMAHLHSLDYLHGDLKPDNILVETGNGQPLPRITDLGLAVRNGTQFPTEIRGSQGYMAPEVLEGQPLTEASDVYSFGQILRELVGSCTEPDIAEGLTRLARFCIEPAPEKRPQNFWEVEHRISRFFTPPRVASRHSAFFPPLRPAGVRLRLRLIGRLFAADNHPGHAICLVAGPPGIGKSKVIREFCLEKQLEGQHTLRITGAGSITAINAGLPALIEKASQFSSAEKNLPVQWVFVETAPSFRLTPRELNDLLTLATSHAVRIVLEAREPGPIDLPPGIGVVRIPPLTVRECIASSSHMTDRSLLAIANGKSLHVASGGIPQLMRLWLRDWLLTGCHGQPAEPGNFDGVTGAVADYWSEQVTGLSDESRAILAGAAIFHRTIFPAWLAPPAGGTSEPVSLLEDLVTTGWLKCIDRETESRRYQFSARSARNYIRSQFDCDWLQSMVWGFLNQEELTAQFEKYPQELWELHHLARSQSDRPSASALAAKAASIADWKQVIHGGLREFRRNRREPVARALQARLISDGYGRLGCSRRQVEWAGTALRLMSHPATGAGLTLDEARWRCRLLDFSGDLQEKERLLAQLLESVPASHRHVRGYLLSELGSVHILRSDLKRARAVCHEAYHLLLQTASDSEEFTRNLNRLGLSLLLSGSYDQAQKQLNLCRTIAARHGWEDVGWRCLGNLGILAKNTGNPQLARNYQRQVADHYRRVGDPVAHVRALLAMANCDVDLGQGYAALRWSRFAVALAGVIGELDQSAKAHSSLGWVLTMRGDLGQARTQLETAIGLDKRTGNQIDVAKCHLNLARLYLVAADGPRAQAACATAMEVYSREQELEGIWEARRLWARAAMVCDDYAAASEHLTQIPLDNPLLTPRDRVETNLTWFALHLWNSDLERAELVKARLLADPMMERVHPVRCEMDRLLGLMALKRREFDLALQILSSTATRCRISGRVDHQVETLKIMAILARDMRNWRIGIRYLRSVESLINRMRGELT